jgi:hypothetical protein
MQSVLIGTADACGTAERALLHFEKEKQVTARFRILYKTKPPPPLFLLRTILGWPNTEEGRKIIRSGRFIPFTAARDADYAQVRRYVRASSRFPLR